MKSQGDTTRPRSVKAQFDSDFSATANGGAVMAEKTLRALGLRRIVRQHLAARMPLAKFSMEDVAHAFVGAQLVGGKGICATERLREDALLSDIFGLEKGAPSDSTLYRVLCELLGLDERKVDACYVPSGRGLAALDMFGNERREPARRRVVPDEPEAAGETERRGLDAFGTSVAVRCAGAIARTTMRLHDWHVTFGDATDLEVEGSCFDAARMGRDGSKVIRWQTLTLGPILVAQQLHEGNTDEGLSMPRLLGEAKQTVRKILGARARVLALLDAAYFEKQIVDPLTEEMKWDFIICANQQRGCLKRQVLWEHAFAAAGRLQVAPPLALPLRPQRSQKGSSPVPAHPFPRQPTPGRGRTVRDLLRANCFPEIARNQKPSEDCFERSRSRWGVRPRCPAGIRVDFAWGA